MNELTDAQIVDRLRRRYRSVRRFSVAVRSLGWDYNQAYRAVHRAGAAKEFGLGKRRIMAAKYTLEERP